MNEEIAATLQTSLQQVGGIVVPWALSAAGAIAVLIIGFIVAGLLSRWTRKALERIHATDETLARFLSKMVRYAVMLLVLVTVLAQFGVQTTSIIAALGAAGLAIGLALQGTLANIASGIMLLVLRPFQVGEFVVAGSVSGTVQEIGLFVTELKQPDGLFVMAPNSALWSSSIVNYSRNPTRRFDLTIGIGYDDDMGRARQELLALAKQDGRILIDPAPVAFVASLDDSAVSITLRVWSQKADYLAMTWDLTELAKQRFDDVGISIPYPQREITQKIVGGSNG